MPRQLELARRNDFFSDPFFSDLMSIDNDDMFSKRLDLFKQNKALVGTGKQETAHNLQVSASKRQVHDPAGAPRLRAGGLQPQDKGQQHRLGGRPRGEGRGVHLQVLTTNKMS